MTSALIIGAGDMGERIAHGLGASGSVRQITMAGRSARVVDTAAAVASCFDVGVRAEVLDCRDVASVAALIRRTEPDLIVQTAALMGPWALGDRQDPLAVALGAAGLAVRLPLQLPILVATMRAVRDVGYTGPVANLSFPDVTHHLLDRVDLAPTIGLGNVAMYLLRARAALRAEIGPDASMPLIRVVGQHHHVYDVMQARRPVGAGGGPWVWVGDGDDTVRRDDLAHAGHPVAPGIAFNAITAASALPVLLALLPGASPLRWSTPAPLGMRSGFPVCVENGAVTLDLPSGVDVGDCTRMCDAEAAGDGVDHIDDAGVVHFSRKARTAMRDVAPELTEPFSLADADRRAQHILDLVHATRR